MKLGEKLRKRIRAIRKQRGFTTAEFAQLLGCSQSKISYLESGRSQISVSFLEALLEKFNLSENELIDSSEGQLKSLHPQEAFHFLERANLIRQYTPLLVPMHLQVENYAKAVLYEMWPIPEVWDLKSVRTQLKRRLSLAKLMRTKDFKSIFNVAALHHTVGSSGTMVQQIESLFEDIDRFDMTDPKEPWQAIPFVTFTIFDHTAVETETFSGLHYSMKHEDIMMAEGYFNHFSLNLLSRDQKLKELDNALSKQIALSR